MSRKFEGKIVVVTGGGRGMGRTIAEAFAREGARVAIGARTLRYGDETVAAFQAEGWTATVYQCDCRQRADVIGLVDHAAKTFGGIDIIVHSAGEVPHGSLLKMADEALESAIATSIKAAYWLTQRGSPYLKASSAGRLLFVSSICGPRTVVSGMTAYAITKSAINTFIRSAALELIGDGITVNGVEPGVTWTDGMRANSTEAQRNATLPSIPAGRFGEAEEVARAILFLAEPEAGYITGQTIVVDGGMSLSSTDAGDIGTH